MSKGRNVSGTVLMLKCIDCGSVTPHFRFEGEDDVETMGLGSASSCTKNEVVVSEMRTEERNQLEMNGVSTFEKRINKELGREDLRVIRLIRIREFPKAPIGTSFQEFRKHYQPPELVFTCACCSVGESKIISEISITEFQANGGTLTTIGGIHL